MNWKKFIKSESEKDYYKKLTASIVEDGKSHTIYPHHKDIFNAFKYCPLDQVKTVILGQDPYINPREAHGLSFSVPIGTLIPPSLRNIFKELQDDLSIAKPTHGCLTSWAQQGVLLLNSILTVRQGQSNSHRNFGWETFTNAAIELVNQQDHPIAYLLWGQNARNKKNLITNPKHLILEAAHPSPLSAYNGFFGCKHFSKTNNFLIQNNIQPIDWQNDKEV